MAPPQQQHSKDYTAHPHQPGAHSDPPHPDRAHSSQHHPVKAKVKFPLRNRISPTTTFPKFKGKHTVFLDDSDDDDDDNGKGVASSSPPPAKTAQHTRFHDIDDDELK